MSSEVSYSTIIDIEKSKAWENLQDLSLAHNYVPGINRTEITTEKATGVGASRRVYGNQSGMKVAMDETVTQWDEGDGFAIKLHRGDKGPPMFASGYFVYKLDEENGKTRLTTTMGYTMPWGILGTLLDVLMIKRIVYGNIRDVALSMRLFYETGNKTQPADLKKIKKSEP